MTDLHFHRDDQGILHKCYHKCKTNWKAWIIAGFIALIAYPVEHTVWERVPPFNYIAQHLGLEIGHDSHG